MSMIIHARDFKFARAQVQKVVVDNGGLNSISVADALCLVQSRTCMTINDPFFLSCEGAGPETI